MIALKSRFRTVSLSVVGLIIVATAATAWQCRANLLAWYYVQGLKEANESNRDAYAEQVAALGNTALPRLLDLLCDTDSRICDNACQALTRFAADPAALSERWDGFSTVGKACVQRVVAGWLSKDGPTDPALIGLAQRAVIEAARSGNADGLPASLGLASALLAHVRMGESVQAARHLAHLAFSNSNGSVRVAGVRLALYPEMDLLEEVAALLNDSAPEVRRAAILAVGPADQVVRDEGLLQCLHDKDREVQRLAESALRGRGLGPEHLLLGRLLTDPNPVQRLQVLDQLRRTPDLDANLWLRRLSHDPSPAVRAAALRAMSQQTSADLADRLDQMARNDPSPTVCLLARYYLKTAKPANSEPRE